MLERLGHVVVRRRRLVIAAWVVLTIFDATVIRALLVPALMRLLGRWNWWFPRPAARALFVRVPEPRREATAIRSV
jgi:uncharacterized membrane protein YdfJ with MMPL/SSD domain